MRRDSLIAKQVKTKELKSYERKKGNNFYDHARQHDREKQKIFQHQMMQLELSQNSTTKRKWKTQGAQTHYTFWTSTKSIVMGSSMLLAFAYHKMFFYAAIRSYATASSILS